MGDVRYPMLGDTCRLESSIAAVGHSKDRLLSNRTAGTGSFRVLYRFVYLTDEGAVLHNKGEAKRVLSFRTHG